MPIPPKNINLTPGEKAAGAFVCFLILVLLILGVFGNNGLVTYLQLKERRVEMKVDLDKLEEENRKLSREIKSLREDPAAIERVARDELGMVKPGEVLYKVRETAEGGNK